MMDGLAVKCDQVSRFDETSFIPWIDIAVEIIGLLEIQVAGGLLSRYRMIKKP